MTKIYNVGLIGYGKMAKMFKKEINCTKKFRLIKIISKRDIKENTQTIKNFFKLEKLNLIIIASPINSHFEYLNHAIKNQKNVIVEKPLVENFNQLKKLYLINKNNKKKIMIHHNDFLNFEKFKIFKKIKNFKKLQKVEMIYGNKEIINKYKKPFFDWLPHPLSIIVKYFGIPKRFNILEYTKFKKKGKLKENLKIEFIFSGYKIFLNFSNFLKKKTKKIFIFQNNKKEIYDGYKEKNRKTIKILLKKFYEKKRINDISTDLRIYKLLFKIDNKLKIIK